MYNVREKKININNIITYCLYTFIISIALNPILTYFFHVASVHLFILVFMLYLIVLRILGNRNIITSRIFLPIMIYLVLVILGLLRGGVELRFFAQSLSHRVLFPIIFLLFFLLIEKVSALESISYNLIKIINIVCIIMGLTGLIEKHKPAYIYNLYGSGLTEHLTLLINGNNTTRLLSLAGNPINLGFYMAIGIGSTLTIILINYKKIKTVALFQIPFLLLFIYIMFFTYSRSAIAVTFTIVLTIFILNTQKNTLKNKVISILLVLGIYIFLSNKILNIETISSRLDTLSFEQYFENTRFLRAKTAFDKDNNVIQILFGHGITKINESNSFVFELGYASLIYESGVIGFIAVISSYISGIISGIKYNTMSDKSDSKHKTNFFIAVIVSGLVGMFVEDLYMQQPYNVYLWFSTLFLLFQSKKVTIVKD